MSTQYDEEMDDCENLDSIKIPHDECCEICSAPATFEYDGQYYCQDCYDTDILHE